MSSPVLKMKYKAMIKDLIQFYNNSIKFFVDVPPDSNSHMPVAFNYKRSVKKKQPDIVTINYNKMLFRERNQQHRMATSTRKTNRWWVILVNKKVCKHIHPYSTRFILLHEMVHVRRRVLGSDYFVNREYQDMNLDKAKVLFDKLNKEFVEEIYNGHLKTHGYDFVMLCHFLTNNLLKDRSFLQRTKVLTYDKLIKRIYFYDRQEEVIDAMLNEIN